VIKEARPLLALTAFAEPRDRDEAFASGFQEYLNKPVDAGILANAILKLTRHGDEGRGAIAH
jgi:CheY-like chemotaxis protein